MTKDEIKTEEQMVFEFQEALMSRLDIDAALSATTRSMLKKYGKSLSLAEIVKLTKIAQSVEGLNCRYYL